MAFTEDCWGFAERSGSLQCQFLTYHLHQACPMLLSNALDELSALTTTSQLDCITSKQLKMARC